MYPRLPIKLIDSQLHGLNSEAELFVVEGDSASHAVAKIRHAPFQAVLPMQGKPLNAFKAREKTVRANPFFMALVDAIGTDMGESFELARSRYQRIVLLFDPDADGIHCGTLVLLFFYRWMKPLLEGGHVIIVRPPLMEIVSDQLVKPLLAYSEEEGQRICHDLAKQHNARSIKKRFRGLASLNADILVQCCIDPTTRKASCLTPQDAEGSIEILASMKANVEKNAMPTSASPEE